MLTWRTVFANADSGEGYINVFGNEGDRNNLTLWRGIDQMIANVTAVSSNVIVVIHSVGAVLLPWVDNENVTAIVWAGLPGQESGNSLVGKNGYLSTQAILADNFRCPLRSF